VAVGADDAAATVADDTGRLDERLFLSTESVRWENSSPLLLDDGFIKLRIPPLDDEVSSVWTVSGVALSRSISDDPSSPTSLLASATALVAALVAVVAALAAPAINVSVKDGFLTGVATVVTAATGVTGVVSFVVTVSGVDDVSRGAWWVDP
jgi:hypothetical protein